VVRQRRGDPIRPIHYRINIGAWQHGVPLWAIWLIAVGGTPLPFLGCRFFSRFLHIPQLSLCRHASATDLHGF